MGVYLREKKLADGRRSLYLDIYHDGRRRYETLEIYLDKDTPANRAANREKRQTANLIRNKWENDLAENAHGFEGRQRRKTSFLAFFEKLTKAKASGTRGTWQSAQNHLKSYAGDRDVLFNQVTPEWIRGFQDYLLTVVNTNSAATLFAKLKAALREAVRQDILLSNPVDKLPRRDDLKKVEPRRVYLSFEELQQLAAKPCPDPEVGRAFLFACYTGIRLSDVERLTHRMIRGRKVEFRQQKVKSEEYLDLSEQALQLVGSGAPDDLVFSLPNRDKIGAVLKAWGAAAKVPQKITFHVSRHTYATLLLTYGADLYVVSKLLGHTSIQATQIYAQIIDRRRQEAVSLIPPLSGSVLGN